MFSLTLYKKYTIKKEKLQVYKYLKQKTGIIPVKIKKSGAIQELILNTYI